MLLKTRKVIMYILVKTWVLYMNEQSEIYWLKVVQGDQERGWNPPFSHDCSSNLIRVYYCQPQCKRKFWSHCVWHNYFKSVLSIDLLSLVCCHEFCKRFYIWEVKSIRTYAAFHILILTHYSSLSFNMGLLNKS